ncbi:MAG: metal ABC transporter permease [Planctomycetota bacterium]
MLETLDLILQLFPRSFFGALVVGAVSPLLGVFFILRRMVFLGIAVPQFAAAGIALGFLVMHQWNCTLAPYLGGEVDVEGSFCYHLFFATLFTFLSLLVLVWLGRRGSGSPEGRIAGGYVVAAAATILFLSESSLGTSHVDVLLKGDVIVISEVGLTAILGFFGLALLVLLLLRRDFLLVAYDRELAVSQGKRVVAWDISLYLLVGSAISVGVLTVGPLVVFGLMVLPPLAARLIAFNMVSFYAFSSLLGVFTSFLGFILALELDWPLGPTAVVTAFLLLFLVWLGRRGVAFLGVARE